MLSPDSERVAGGDADAAGQADRLAESQHFVIDGGVTVGHFLVALRAALDMAIPIMQRQKDLLVVTRGIVGWIDHQKAELARIRGTVHIVSGEGVRVVPAKSGRPRLPGVSLRTALGRRFRRSFLGSSVLHRGNMQPVPVNDVRHIGFVHHINRDLLPFRNANQVAGNTAVESGRLHRFTRGDLQMQGRDANRIVC